MREVCEVWRASLEGAGAAAGDGGGETVMVGVGVGNDCCWRSWSELRSQRQV